jgi:1-acyl-sn-glycerol-3-phosphate acyltransferase
MTLSAAAAPAPTSPPAAGPLLRLAQRGWRGFCRALVTVFYRRVEVDGLEKLPARGPLLLCANHADALADAVLVQARIPRAVHPLARSGLFENPLLRVLLEVQQAVPIYRRQDSDQRPRPGPASSGGGPDRDGPGEGPDELRVRNEESFARCHGLLARGEALLIFPEGQSHSDPRLRPIKTGAARLALSALARNGEPPLLVPLGLTFSRKGRFRSSVLLRLGDPLRPARGEDEGEEAAVRRVTAELQAGLEAVTLNLESWEELDLLRRIQRFFAFRRGRRRYRRSLAGRLRALQHLQQAHRWLRQQAPAQVAALSRRLARFERLCRRYGVDDYALTVRYTPLVVARFVARTLGLALVVLPLALWAVLNSALPYLSTRHAARRLARGTDQHDTAKMLLGILFFALFWGGQSALVWWRWGTPAALAYAASLPPTAAMALALGRERERVVENLRMFLAFTRRGELRAYLLARRRELEREIARLVRRARSGRIAS